MADVNELMHGQTSFPATVETEFLNSEIYEISKFLSCDLAHVFATESFQTTSWGAVKLAGVIPAGCVWYNGLFLATWEVFADLFGSLISTFLLGEGTLSTAQRVVVMFGTQNLHLRGTTNCNVFLRNYLLDTTWNCTLQKTKSGKNASSSMWKRNCCSCTNFGRKPTTLDWCPLNMKTLLRDLAYQEQRERKEENSAANATRFDAFKTDWWTCLQTFWLEIMRSTLAYSSKADYTYWWGDERRKALGKGTSRNWGQEFWMFWVSWNCGVRELEKIMFRMFSMSHCVPVMFPPYQYLIIASLCIYVRQNHCYVSQRCSSFWITIFFSVFRIYFAWSHARVMWCLVIHIPLLRVFEERHRHEQANSTVLLFSFHMHIITCISLL